MKTIRNFILISNNQIKTTRNHIDKMMIDSTIKHAKQASSIDEEVKINNFREATTTATDDSSAASTPTNSKFVCYLATRSGKLG